MSEKYNFDTMTEGMTNLTNGYIDYAKEVIINRALPALQDGMKPVNRRILATLHSKFKAGSKVKSADLVGSVMQLHPHGDATIYSALVLLTDRNGSMELPVLSGQGNFGGVSTTDPPAASRYTEVKAHPNTEEYFKDLDGINFIPSYDSRNTEPEYLPVTYPAVLCNAQEGIAVGFSCNIPSFNFNDVLDLTSEYIRDGKCSTVICPDFVTGGYYVRNNKELTKLMQTGSAKLKLRGKVTKVGKELTIVEFPYGVKIQNLVSQINKANIAGVRDCGDVSDFDNGAGILVDCVKNKTDDVLLSLYKNTDLQTSISANIFVVLNGEPVKLGVWGVIEEWVKWRRQVVKKKLECEEKSLIADIAESRAFLEVFNDKEKLAEVTRLILKVSDEDAVKYILDNFDNEIVTPDYAKWITSRRINVFRTGGKYVARYNQLESQLETCRMYINDVDKYILDELADLKAREGANHPRRTEVTSMDYEFKATDGVEQKDDTVCLYTLKDGFLRKSRFIVDSPDAEYSFTASASDTLVALDNRGRVLRIYCEDLPYVGNSELGIYLPKYLELNESDDYRITWIGVLDGKTKMLLYRDGNVGFLDTSEWVGLNRKVRVIEKGIAQSVADQLGAVLEDIPEFIYVLDSKGRMSGAIIGSIKRKDRTAKTRVFNPAKDCSVVSYAPMSVNEAAVYVMNAGRYTAPKFQYLESAESLNGDPNIFIPMM